MLHSERSEVQRYVKRTEKFLNEIVKAQGIEELRDAWEEFLNNFARSIGKMISAGKLDPNLRPWAHRLKNASTQDDEGLVYLREARNSVEHGLRPFAEFAPARYSIGGSGLVSISPVQGFSEMSGVSIEGENIDYLRVNVQGGQMSTAASGQSVPVVWKPSEISLVPVCSPDKKLTFEVPKKLGGKVIDPTNPEELAAVAMARLHEIHGEFLRGQA